MCICRKLRELKGNIKQDKLECPRCRMLAMTSRDIKKKKSNGIKKIQEKIDLYVLEM